MGHAAHAGYHGIQLCEIPPNGQGLTALMALGILRHLDIRRYPVDSADSIHLQVEAMKLAFAESWRHIADPAAMEVDPQHLLTEAFLADRAAKIRMDQAGMPRAAMRPEGGTVYLSTADRNGMMVSYIQSNYMGFGSGIVIADAGISCKTAAGASHSNRGIPTASVAANVLFTRLRPAL